MTPEGIHPAGKARSDRAFVTLATNPDYATGAAALFRSLRRTGTTADLVLLYTDLPQATVDGLRMLDVRAVRVDLLPTSDASTPCMPATGCTAPRLYQGRKAALPHAAGQFRQAAAVAAGL